VVSKTIFDMGRGREFYEKLRDRLLQDMADQIPKPLAEMNGGHMLTEESLRRTSNQLAYEELIHRFRAVIDHIENGWLYQARECALDAMVELADECEQAGHLRGEERKTWETERMSAARLIEEQLLERGWQWSDESDEMIHPGKPGDVIAGRHIDEHAKPTVSAHTAVALLEGGAASREMDLSRYMARTNYNIRWETDDGSFPDASHRPANIQYGPSIDQARDFADAQALSNRATMHVLMGDRAVPVSEVSLAQTPQTAPTENASPDPSSTDSDSND
jgi:hypothetical protein